MLLSLALADHHLFDHSGLDVLSHVVLPKDLGLSLGLHHQTCNPQTFLFVFLDERVDVFRHLSGHSTTPHNVLFTDLHDRC